MTTSDIEIAADLFAFATAPGTPADKFLEAYVCDLLPRWAEAATVPRLRVDPAEGYQLNHRHGNAALWTRAHPEDATVRGWVTFDHRGLMIFGFPPFRELVAHSVVRRADGSLVDITPTWTPAGEAGLYPFLPHDGDDESFMAMVERYRLLRFRLFDEASGVRITYFSDRPATAAERAENAG